MTELERMMADHVDKIRGGGVYSRLVRAEKFSTITAGYDVYKCSYCDFKAIRPNHNYCPSCGGKIVK